MKKSMSVTAVYVVSFSADVDVEGTDITVKIVSPPVFDPRTFVSPIAGSERTTEQEARDVSLILQAGVVSRVAEELQKRADVTLKMNVIQEDGPAVVKA